MSGKRVVSCLAVVLRESGEILLVRRRGSGRWTLPGGRLEPEESWRACAGREAEEETGIKLDLTAADHELVLHNKDKGGVRIYYFARWQSHQGEAKNREPHLHEEVSWFGLDNLPANMAQVLRLGISGVLNGGGVVESGFSAELAGKNGFNKKRPVGKKPRATNKKAGAWARLMAYLFPPMR